MENELKKQDFLQSKEWREFQEKAGSRTFLVEQDGSASPADKFSASIIEHELLIVGGYFYVPHWPSARILNLKFQILNEFPILNDQISNEFKIQNSKFKICFLKLIQLAKENNAGWIRVDVENKNSLEIIKRTIFGNPVFKIVKAPHDMQPKEIFVLDISKSKEDLLSEMSQKTRYNIKLAEKRGVIVKTISNDKFQMTNQCQNPNDKTNKYLDEFLRLVKATAKRKGINFHAEDYYRKMVETIPENMLKLYVAEYQNKIIAANLVVFYGDAATYLHGATDDEYRNVMAPHLLQWQAILDAKEACLKFYDFGGIKTQDTRYKIQDTNSWAGITKFKLGFSPNTKPIEFLGSYDIIINPWKYAVYRMLQKIKSML